MKKVIAYIALILYVGCTGGILLNTYTDAGNAHLNECYTACCFPINSTELGDASSNDQFSTHQFIACDALATSIGKVKLPDASSFPVITARFTISPYRVNCNFELTDPAQLHTQPAPIFLQNCVLRL